MRLRPAATTTVTITLVVAMATLPLREVFGGWAWTLSVIGASLAAATIASIAESTRRDLVLAEIAALTAGGAVGWSLLVPLRGRLFVDPLSSAPWRELADGMFNGWGALLEERFPLTEPAAAETFAAVVVWIATAVAVHVAARRRTALAAVGAGAFVLWISTAAALPSGLAPAIFGTGAGIMALFAISTLTRAPEQHWRARRTLALGAVAVVVGAAATLGGATSTSLEREPFDPRSSVETELRELEVPDILAEFGVRRDAGETVMTVDSAVPTSDLRLRLQVYETHDGERWLPAVQFQEVTVVPEPAVLPAGDIVRLTIAPDTFEGPWIPLPDRLIRTDLRDFRWNEDTQTALTDGAPGQFVVTGSVVPRSGLEGLDSARDDTRSEVREIPAGLPDVIRTVAETVSIDATDAIGAIDAVTARVRELGRDEDVAPGHSFGRLSDDLQAGRAAGAEQIASLHALMLRSIGIPSRLVVGYVASSPVVESADLHVWTEAAFPGLGWVPFDPVPAMSETAPTGNDDPTATTTTLVDGPVLEARALPGELGPGEDPDETQIGADRDLTIRDVLVAAAGLAVLVVLTLITTRLVRRRLRRSSSSRPDVRVLGAWAELVDRLREVGAPIAATTTIGDIVYMASAMDEELGDRVADVGELAAIARYSPGGARSDQAAKAWARLYDVESRLTVVRGRHTVALRYLDPRVLRYRAPDPSPR